MFTFWHMCIHPHPPNSNQTVLWKTIQHFQWSMSRTKMTRTMKMIVKLEPCYPLVVHDQIGKVSEIKYLLRIQISLSNLVVMIFSLSYDYQVNVIFQVANPFECMEGENQMRTQQPNFQRWWMTIVISQIDVMLYM